MRDSKLVCPKCGRADAVRKVTSIVDEGTTFTESNRLGMTIGGDDAEFYSGFGNSVSRTGLATTLAAPKKPTQPFRRGWSGIFPNVRWTCAGSILALIMSSAICSFRLLFWNYRENPLLILVPVVIFLSAAILLIRWAWLSNRREIGTLREEQEQFPLQLEAWNRAIDRWRQLYYCHRDDGVFIPAQTRLIPVNEMGVFLYSPHKKKR